MATVKANTTLVITPKNGATYDLTLGGITQYGRTTGDTIGLFPVDKEYTLVKHGEVEVYAIDQYGNKSYEAADLPASLPAGTSVVVDGQLLMSDGPNIGLVVEVANKVVISGGVAGATTGWIPKSANPERFGFQLTGGSASITLDGSNDMLTSAGQVATVSLDTSSVTYITPPISPAYPFIRFTVNAVGASSSVTISRGM